jgi:tripartite-type tricarboxylate transporter receptor subunit TctC
MPLVKNWSSRWSGAAYALGLLFVAFHADVATGQGFPDRNVTLVVPYTPGATVDATARVVASGLSKLWNVPVVVENRPGGSTTIGARYVGSSTPDGYTLLLTIDDTFTTTPHLAEQKSFKPMSELVPVSLVAKLVNAIVVNPGAPFDTLPTMLAYAKEHPGELRYGSPGLGSNSNLAMEVLKSVAKVDIQHVPYRGIAPATNAAVSGEVHMTFAGYSAKGLIEAGSLKPIVVAGPDRFVAFPTLPTTVEAGYPTVDSSTWIMIAAPIKTPTDIVAKISDSVKKILANSDTRKTIADTLGLVVGGVGSTEAIELLKHIDQVHAEAVRLSGADKE